jgi:MFS family permease
MHLPMLLFAPLFGALLDRWNRSGVIMAVDVIRALLIVTIPSIFVWTDSIHSVYVPVVFISVADLLFSPARSALIPALTEPRRLLQVNAVFWGLGIVGTLLGFLLGGWFFDYLTWETSFYTNAVTYALAGLIMVPVIWMHREGRVKHGVSGARPTLVESVRLVVRSIRDGMVLIREHRHVAVCLIAQTVLFALGGVMYVIGVARIQGLFPPGKTIYLSVMTTCLLTGLLVGSWIASFFRDRTTSQRTIAVASLLCGVSIVGIAATETITPLSVWAALLGLSISPVFILTETLLQKHIPDAFRGRVFSTREALIKVAFLTSSIVATAMSAFVAKATILIAVGLFLALLGVVLERTKWLDIKSNAEGDV